MSLRIIAVMFMMSTVSLSQDAPAFVDRRPGPGPVQIDISANHDAVSVGSPLVLTMKMTNTGQEEHCYKLIRGYAMFNFKVDVLDASGGSVPTSPSAESHIPRISSGKTECLQAGKSLSQDMRLDELYDLRTPGSYKVKVSRLLIGRGGQEVQSNVVGFTIVP